MANILSLQGGLALRSKRDSTRSGRNPTNFFRTKWFLVASNWCNWVSQCNAKFFKTFETSQRIYFKRNEWNVDRWIENEIPFISEIIFPSDIHCGQRDTNAIISFIEIWIERSVELFAHSERAGIDQPNTWLSSESRTRPVLTDITEICVENEKDPTR